MDVVELRKQVEPLLRKPWEAGLSDEDDEAYYVGVREGLDAVDKTVLPQLQGAVGEAEALREAISDAIKLLDDTRRVLQVAYDSPRQGGSKT